MKSLKITGLFAEPISFDRLINRLPINVVLIDKSRRIVYLNQKCQALTGFDQEKAKGLPCRHVLRTNLCGTNKCPANQVGKDSEPVCWEGNIINLDREKIPVRVTSAPLIDIDGNLVGFLETFEDLRTSQTVSTEQREVPSFGTLLGHSKQIEKVFQIVPEIGQTDSSVLITGETGTGKDMLAEIIHQQSNRAKGPFIKVNCGALPESLLESELFGHRKGAFTGATENKPGRFKLAHNGTLFLTEIGDLPLSLQVKLLSFLDDQVIYPLGSGKGVQLNVRIIAATNRNLQKMVQEGTFRQDLMYRLNVVRVNLPPLREREGDVRLLMDHFLQYYAQKFNKTIIGFSDKALQVLLFYPYPGNVRELRNIVEYAINICREEKIDVQHLPAYILEKEYQDISLPEQPRTESLEVAERLKDQDNLTWSQTEKQMILEALVKSKGKKKQAADLLGWGRSTLWRKIKNYGLDK